MKKVIVHMLYDKEVIYMDSNKLKEIRKKIAKAEKIPIIGKILKKYYRKQLFKEIRRIVQSKRKEEANEFF